MTAALPDVPVPARSGTSITNDDGIRTATITCLVRDGYLETSLDTIAREADPSSRPVHDRFNGLADAAADAWTHRAGPALAGVLEAMLDAALPSPNADTTNDGAADVLATGFAALLDPSPELLAAREILIAAPFEPGLMDAVQHGPLTDVLARCTSGASVTETAAAQATSVLVIAIGLLDLHGAKIAPSTSIEQVAHDFAAALANPAQPHSEQVVAGYTTYSVAVTHDDPVMRALLSATLEEVAARSYTGATTARIAARAGIHPSKVFNRFPTKLDLFTAAIQARLNSAMLDSQEKIEQAGQEVGPGLAEEAAWRLYMCQDARLTRTPALELLRLTWHVPELRELEDESHRALTDSLLSREIDTGPYSAAGYTALNVALGYGVMTLAALLPDAWRLPFAVVTIPLLEGAG